MCLAATLSVGLGGSGLVNWGFLFRVRQYTKGSLWIVPVVGGVAGSLLGAAADTGTIFAIPERWTYSAGTAETLLGAVVGASVGLTGFVVTVSVLMVQMATGTFSARYMRLFYRDGLLKAVLAVLVGSMTFSYSLLRHVEQESVPNFGVTLAGVFLAAGVLLFLIFLDRSIHRLRPVAVAALVARAGRRAFEDVMRASESHDAPSIDPRPHESDSTVVAVRSTRAGAIQAVHAPGLALFARARGCRIVVPRAAGDFVAEGETLMEVHGVSELEAKAERRLRSMVALGVERTIEQDPAFAIRVMVDIAIRALSPAVNDPTTAVQVINHLGDTLRFIGTTPLEEWSDRVHNGRPEVVMRTRSWEDVLTLAITEIREYGGSSVQVVRRLRALLEGLSESVLPQHLPAVKVELDRLDATVAEHWSESVDLDLATAADRQGIGGQTTPGLAS